MGDALIAKLDETKKKSKGDTIDVKNQEEKDQKSDQEAGLAAGCLKSYLIKPTDSRLALCKQIILKYFMD